MAEDDGEGDELALSELGKASKTLGLLLSLTESLLLSFFEKNCKVNMSVTFLQVPLRVPFFFLSFGDLICLGFPGESTVVTGSSGVVGLEVLFSIVVGIEA